MKKSVLIILALVGFVVSSQGIVTNTVQFGGYEPDRGWASEVVTNAAVSPTEYSVSFGVPERYENTEISNLLFTVTFSETNGIPIYMVNSWLGGTIDDGVVDRRLNGSEAIKLKVSYSDPNNRLLSLKAAGFSTYYNTQSYETTVFSDGVSNFSLIDTDNDFIQDYDATGLVPLSTSNVETWSLLVTVDDSLGGGTNFTESGAGSLVLEYVADTEYIATVDRKERAVFEFVDGCEFDAAGIGATMVRTNSHGATISITTVDIIGLDGTRATNGVDNKTNVTGDIKSLGINSENNGEYSSEWQDFNPGEAWIVSFDVDVVLDFIDLSGGGSDTEMTISSSAFDDVVLLGMGDGKGGFELGNVAVPVGATVMFQMTSTSVAASTSLRIEKLFVDIAAKVVVESALGNPEPGIGTNAYASGDDVFFFVEPSFSVNHSNFVCTGWTGTGSVPASGTGTSTGVIQLNTATSSIVWNWVLESVDLWVDFEVEGSGSVSAADGWYTEGSTQTVFTVADYGWTFTGWGGDASGLSTNLEIVVASNMTIIASFSDDPDNDGLTNLEEEVLGTEPLFADTDGDGLKDGDEVSWGTLPLVYDTDGDGTGDGYEIELGFNPLDPNDDPDKDADQILDSWELEEFGGLQFCDPEEDPDNDLYTNLMEFQHGTDPNVVSHYIEQYPAFEITWLAIDGANYQVQVTGDLVGGSWSNVGSVVTGEGERAGVLVPTRDAENKSFRVLRLP